MRGFVFAKRTFREVLRDPLTIIFGIGFPGSVSTLEAAYVFNKLIVIVVLENTL